VLLIHGWGLSHHSYAGAGEALAAQGFRVISPDLPGFGASTDLPINHVSFHDYASALHKFLIAVEGEHAPEHARPEPVHVIGHSFGGAVAVQLAHDDPDLVRSLMLVNAASGSVWHRVGDEVRLVADRPAWDWGLHLLSEFPLGNFPGTPVTVLRDLAHNLWRHPVSISLVAHLIRRSDLHTELGIIAAKGVPVSVVWANGDRVVTRSEYEDQCVAACCVGTEVRGNHGWLLNDPQAFGAVVGDVLRATKPVRRTGAKRPKAAVTVSTAPAARARSRASA
jgi:pimeloyl-ACP methyl ester carboxylesterase